MTVTYKNGTELFTIGQAIKFYNEFGLCLIVDEGRHVTVGFESDHPVTATKGK